ncbi:MAG: hypothetical protein ACFFAU_10570 [Candidatus Hodarchaeota archaeon]
MSFPRLLEKFRTEIMAIFIAISLIASGLIAPAFIPDEFPDALPGFRDTTWLKAMISVLFIGMGLVSFIWLVVIHRFILHKSKKDYMY